MADKNRGASGGSPSGFAAAPVKVYAADRIRAAVPLSPQALDVIREAFVLLHAGRAHVPPVMMLPIPEHEGEIDVKSAFMPDLDHLAVKIATGFPQNHHRGLPVSSGMMVVVSTHTGRPAAVLLDDGYLTQLRTALAGAVAAEQLARPEIDTVGVIGTGGQARWQLRALRLVRDYRRILIFGRTRAKAEELRSDLLEDLGVDAEVLSSARELVHHSDLVVTTTSAHQPLVEGAWLHPGQHITAMGSDAPGKRELADTVLSRADVFVCDLLAQSRAQGELGGRSGESAGPERIAELGGVIRGTDAGRESADQITVADLTGVGVQDTAIANFAYRLLA